MNTPSAILATKSSRDVNSTAAILAIESSCDETAAAIYDLTSEKLLSSVVVSQIDIFKAYGGVIPEVAARSHLEAILPVLDEAFAKAGSKTASNKNDWSKISAIAVTHTPGLLGSLLIGTLTARTLAILHQKPLYPIHHLKSHIFSAWLSDDPEETNLKPTFPLLALVISGGHTQIIKMTSETDFKIIGTTLDDAVGECFDKVAKILGLPYPGGPAISAAALGHLLDPKNPEKSLNMHPGNPNKYPLPHPKIKSLDFSFSGLKTAVLRSVQKTCDVGLDFPSHDLKTLLTSEQIVDYAASFEQTAVNILLEKLALALKENPDVTSIVFAGGVSANQRLRKSAMRRFNMYFKPHKENSRISREDHGRLRVSVEPEGRLADRAAVRLNDEKNPTEFSEAKKTFESPLPLFFPLLQFSGDNAAMVAIAAASEIKNGISPSDPLTLNISPRSNLS
ncbi:tRNA (adenosine(37)-N6)-threonylcarbamoyltransferase complex transferase subunit TsaD [Candidatus Saccharibacteria bacterium]|nr:tRNA (adenosine(37)-N6)-threonylcarbamoyltransferase complex transferase subunit TsaD [Candidatus Saccharibacteria bacterium]